MVCDRLTIRIHTQFTGHLTETHSVLLDELDQPAKLALLRRIWLDPESLRPKKTSRDITEAAARSFATLAEGLRKRGPVKDADPKAGKRTPMKWPTFSRNACSAFLPKMWACCPAACSRAGEQPQAHQRQTDRQEAQPVHRDA